MRRLGQLLTTATEYESLDETLARIESLTLDDLRRVVERCPLTPRTIASLHA